MSEPAVRAEPYGEVTDTAGLAHGVSMRQAVRVWAKVAANSFGGPAGQIAVMHRFLVDERRWISERRFLHALNFCMVLPGPEAQQLATYIGWLMHGTMGGLVAGVLFIVPGAVSILALSLVYVLAGDLTAISGLLLGLQAAVVAIVVEAVRRIGARAIKRRAHLLLAAAAFVAIFFLEVPFPVIVLLAAVAGLVIGRLRPGDAAQTGRDPAAAEQALLSDDGEAPDRRARRSAACAAGVALVLWLVPVAVLAVVLGSDHVFAREAVFFSTSAVVTFGGAYAVLSYIAQAAVVGYGWLRPSEMLTGLGMAETTPGPLIMVVQFVGFMAAYRNPGALHPVAAAVLGSLVATWVTFVPCFFFIFAGAPFIERLRGNPRLTHALAGVTAAVVGVILNLAIWFGLNTAFEHVAVTRPYGVRVLVPDLASVNLVAVAIGALSMLLIFRLKWSVMRTLGISAVLGMLVRLLS